MNCPGDQFLAGATFSGNHHIRCRLGHTLHHIIDLFHCRTVADNVIEVEFFINLVFEIPVL